MDVGPVSHERELEQILRLQRENLRGRVDADEATAEGFVTVEHTADTLSSMHALAPSIVARNGATVAGYALAMTRESRALLPILEPMFQQLDGLSWRGRPLSEARFYLMGQICVAKALRNRRSMRAHARFGFEVLHRYEDATDAWAVIGWEFARSK